MTLTRSAALAAVFLLPAPLLAQGQGPERDQDEKSDEKQERRSSSSSDQDDDSSGKDKKTKQPGFDYLRAKCHGGQIVRRGELTFEIVCRENWLKVYAYSQDGTPLELKGWKGQVELTARGMVGATLGTGTVISRGSRTQGATARLNRLKARPKRGLTQDCLAGGHKLGTPSRTLSLEAEVTVGSRKQGTHTFQLTFRGPTPEYTFCCVNEGCQLRPERMNDPGDCPECGGPRERRRVGETGELLSHEEAAKLERMEKLRQGTLQLDLGDQGRVGE